MLALHFQTPPSKLADTKADSPLKPGWRPVATVYPPSPRRGVPVSLRGEDSDHGGPLVDLQHVGERLQDVEVEEGLSGDGAVEPRLHANQTVTPGRPAWSGAGGASPSGRRSSTSPEPWENLRYRSYTLEPLGRTPPAEREDTPLRPGLRLHTGSAWLPCPARCTPPPSPSGRSTRSSRSRWRAGSEALQRKGIIASSRWEEPALWAWPATDLAATWSRT